MPELDLGNVKGPQGKSAYQSALDAGYSGSEEAFNTAMAKAPDAVLYTAQSLTDEQKAQARTNIGADTVQGAVLYTPQSLTDDQKSQARSNIKAAPDGFGLGGSATLLTSADNLDTLMKNGWYYYNTSNAPQGSLPTALAPYATLVHVSAAGNTCVQEAYDATDSNLHGTVLRRTVYGIGSGAKIYPWEWVNPPMVLGVEYRTTERYLGKPVYCKVVDFGTAPNNDTKNVSLSGMNIDKVCGAIFHYYVISSDENGVMTSHPNFTGFLVSNSVIQIRTNTDKTDTKFYVTIKYTKTTD